MRGETGPYGILEYVPNYRAQIFLLSNDVFVPIALPQASAGPVRMVIAAALLCASSEGFQIRVCRRTFRDDVQMVGHEAVRNQCELLLRCRTQNVRQRTRYGSGVDEDSRAIRSTKRQ